MATVRRSGTCIVSFQSLLRVALHHRIVRYRFGGLGLLVRSEVDAYLQERVKGPDSPKKAKSWDLLNHADFVKTLSLGSRPTTPTETKEKPSSRVTVVQGGHNVPPAAVLELTTRSEPAKRTSDIEQKLADLWFSQTLYFIEAYYRSVGYIMYNQLRLQQGKFEDIKAESIGDQLTKWKTANALGLRKLVTVLGGIVEEVKKAQGPCIGRSLILLAMLVQGIEVVVPWEVQGSQESAFELE